MCNKLTLIFILLFVQTGISQKLCNGTILIDDKLAEQVNIVNTTTNKSTVSDSEGNFVISVSVGDVLVFSAVNLETKRKVISVDDIANDVLTVKMSTKIMPLSEVTVNKNTTITAENLRIIPKGQKKYSPAERRLHEATTGGGLVPLNPILNAISGRTTMLKKEIVAEKNERLLLRLDGWFEEKYYIDHLKIPRDYIKGFHYFLIEDNDFVRALRAKNKTLTKFLMNKLVSDYKETIAIK